MNLRDNYTNYRDNFRDYRIVSLTNVATASLPQTGTATPLQGKTS